MRSDVCPVAECVIDPAEILTPEELAERLKVPKSWVYEKTRERASIRDSSPLPCLRVGKYLRFRWPEVSAWLTDKNADKG